MLVDTDAFRAGLIPDSALARRYQPLPLGWAEFISLQSVAEVGYGAASEIRSHGQ